MRHNMRLCWVLLMMTLCSAAGAAPMEHISDQTRQTMILEYGKKIAADQSEVMIPSGSARPFYEQERQQIANQLQLITDNEDTKYLIVVGDTLTIAYKDRDQVNRAAYKVSEAGEIFVPLLGPVKVVGLNRKQARERLEAMAREYIREPRVSVTINTDGRFMLFGAVGLPGIYDLKNKMSVMEAILSAGGFDRRTAELASVIVIRGAVEKPLILKLNLKKMVQRGDRTDDVQVKPGDFIYVPTSFISNLEKFWNTAYNYLMQWYGLGGQEPFPQ